MVEVAVDNRRLHSKPVNEINLKTKAAEALVTAIETATIGGDFVLID
jgi:hypothetical protein